MAPSQILSPIKVVARASTDAFLMADPIVSRAQRFIESNRARNVRVPEVARAIACSRLTLEHHFSRTLDIAPADYIRRRRIEHAKELLKNPSLRIGDISEQVGFLDLAHFSRVFKKQEGVSANEYRNQVLGK